MNFGKAFTYIFDDKRWFEKLLIPLLVLLIPLIGGLVIAGYLMRIIRNVAEHQAEPLPELEFGADLKRGFKWLVGALVYSIPVMLISLVVFIPLVNSINSGRHSVFATLFALLAGLILFFYIIALVFIMPAALANVAMKDSISAAFEFKEIFRLLKNNFKAWLIVLGGSLVCSLFAPLGSIIIIVGALITALFSQLVIAHLTGQAYAHSQTEGGQGALPY